MSNFDYEIQGVRLTDPRGAWNLLEGTDTLPKFPGLRATRYNIPGGSGERQVQHAPIEPTTHLFRVRFHAIDTNESSGTYLKMGRNFDERVAFLERNINEFMFATQLGAQSHLGNVEIRRINPRSGSASTDHYRTSNRVLTAVGRVIASVEPQVSSNGEYADYDFIYENPNGVWFSSWDYRRVSHKPAGTYGIWVYSGTAPIDDALIAIRPSQTMPAGVLVRNEAGIGFRVSRPLAANRWHVFDTFSWSARLTAGIASEDPWWSGPKEDRTIMTEHGRPTGSALVITPGIADNAHPRGKFSVRLTGPGEIRVATRAKWF